MNMNNNVDKNTSATSVSSLSKSTLKPPGEADAAVTRSAKSSSKSRSRPRCSGVEVDAGELEQIVLWLDGLQLSRSRSEASLTRTERDFSDGYLVAELIAHLHPKIVDMHNFSRGCSSKTKRDNWMHLRRKVLPKLNFDINDEHMQHIVEARPGAVNKVLKHLHDIAMTLEAQKREAEEERARASADPLPLEDWKQDVCFTRKDLKGQKEFMIQGKLMVAKDLMTHEVEKRDLELIQLRTSNEQLRSQVARLQMTVDLKEDRLHDLTYELSKYQRQETKVDKFNSPITPTSSPAIGPEGDTPKVANRNSFSKTNNFSK